MNLTQRDYEVLRTLVRVQLATTASLARTFFPDLRAARRRLLTLRSVGGLITPHSKGLPGKVGPTGGQYWRLTETGLQVFTERFPRERVPNNHITRTRNASLRFFEHRDAMTDLYLRLIHSKDRNIDDLHTRANAVDWRCEWEIVLGYQSLEGVQFKPKTIIPDATLSTPNSRFFLEVDQSTESRATCARTLRNYASAFEQPSYRKLFADTLPAVVVYVTRSHTRAEGLTELIESMGSFSFRAVALSMPDAAEWLIDAVTAPAGHLPVPESSKPPVSYDELRRTLEAIYLEYCKDLNARHARGETIGPTPAVMEAYDVLDKIRKAA